MSVNVDKTRFAIDHFALASEFVKRHAISLNGGDHRRHLIEIAMKLFEGQLYLCGIDLFYRTGLDHVAITILRVGSYAEEQGPDILLVLAHQEILDFGPPADHDQQQPGSKRIESPTVTDLLHSQALTHSRYYVVAGHLRFFI